MRSGLDVHDLSWWKERKDTRRQSLGFGGFTTFGAAGNRPRLLPTGTHHGDNPTDPTHPPKEEVSEGSRTVYVTLKTEKPKNKTKNLDALPPHV